MRVILGVDIGTSSSKGVLVTESGEVVATASRAHEVLRPRSGHVEMESRIWWDEFSAIALELQAAAPQALVGAVGVSGMGPCVLLADEAGAAVRPAILYGVDTRSGAQIERITSELGEAQIAARCGSLLTSQAGGPKIAWVAEEEPEQFARARKIFMPASWLAFNLTGEYVLDHQSASQLTPLYDIEAEQWYSPWWQRYAQQLEQPQLLWAGEIAGTVTAQAAERTGIPAGTPVIAGTIDAWSEAVSVGAHNDGDLMLMYGTTMFLVATGAQTLRTPSMWTTAGALPGTKNLAGGLATSGALTQWLKDLTGSEYETLLADAQASGRGARGLSMLPYFAGERTPIQDPNARGVIAGLSLSHTRGDLYRAALEATAFAVRHNIETMRAAGAVIDRVVAVGGGTQGRLWLQIVSDVTGLRQEIPRETIGASYGAAFLAHRATGQTDAPWASELASWNPIEAWVDPDHDNQAFYDERYAQFLELYRGTAAVVHALAAEQEHTLIA